MCVYYIIYDICVITSRSAIITVQTSLTRLYLLLIIRQINRLRQLIRKQKHVCLINDTFVNVRDVLTSRSKNSFFGL